MSSSWFSHLVAELVAGRDASLQLYLYPKQIFVGNVELILHRRETARFYLNEQGKFMFEFCFGTRAVCFPLPMIDVEALWMKKFNHSDQTAAFVMNLNQDSTNRLFAKLGNIQEIIEQQLPYQACPERMKSLITIVLHDKNFDAYKKRKGQRWDEEYMSAFCASDYLKFNSFETIHLLLKELPKIHFSCLSQEQRRWKDFGVSNTFDDIELLSGAEWSKHMRNLRLFQDKDCIERRYIYVPNHFPGIVVKPPRVVFDDSPEQFPTRKSHVGNKPPIANEPAECSSSAPPPASGSDAHEMDKTSCENEQNDVVRESTEQDAEREKSAKLPKRTQEIEKEQLELPAECSSSTPPASGSDTHVMDKTSCENEQNDVVCASTVQDAERENRAQLPKRMQEIEKEQLEMPAECLSLTPPSASGSNTHEMDKTSCGENGQNDVVCALTEQDAVKEKRAMPRKRMQEIEKEQLEIPVECSSSTPLPASSSDTHEMDKTSCGEKEQNDVVRESTEQDAVKEKRIQDIEKEQLEMPAECSSSIPLPASGSDTHEMDKTSCGENEQDDVVRAEEAAMKEKRAKIRKRVQEIEREQLELRAAIGNSLQVPRWTFLKRIKLSNEREIIVVDEIKEEEEWGDTPAENTSSTLPPASGSDINETYEASHENEQIDETCSSTDGFESVGNEKQAQIEEERPAESSSSIPPQPSEKEEERGDNVEEMTQEQVELIEKELLELIKPEVAKFAKQYGVRAKEKVVEMLRGMNREDSTIDSGTKETEKVTIRLGRGFEEPKHLP